MSRKSVDARDVVSLVLASSLALSAFGFVGRDWYVNGRTVIDGSSTLRRFYFSSSVMKFGDNRFCFDRDNDGVLDASFNFYPHPFFPLVIPSKPTVDDQSKYSDLRDELWFDFSAF